jgi:hypothetical protein
MSALTLAMITHSGLILSKKVQLNRKICRFESQPEQEKIGSHTYFLNKLFL